MSSLASIHDFLRQKRLAMIGVSRQPRDFSRQLFNELCRRGYDVVPVNPEAGEIEGRKCFASIEDIHPQVDGAVIMTSAEATGRIVPQCARAGVKRVWLYRAGGAGAVNEQALEFCRSHDMAVIPGECPFMFLPEAGWIHRFHGIVRKVFGGYPH